MTNLFLQIILAIVAVIGPLLYAAINNPTNPIPINLDQFIQLLVWLVSAIFGGSSATIVTLYIMEDSSAKSLTKNRLLRAQLIMTGVMAIAYGAAILFTM